MSERPILFSGPMVQAILDGRKTQTRRVVKPHPTAREQMRGFRLDWLDYGAEPDRQRYGITSSVVDGAEIVCPYGGPGQRLWVRETWRINAWGQTDYVAVKYRADDAISQPIEGVQASLFRPAGVSWNWRSSIHMPRWASRITLEIEAVRCERVQEISPEDCLAEGIDYDTLDTFNAHQYWREEAVAEYQRLWDSINGKTYPWASNPWIWAITFKRIERTNA